MWSQGFHRSGREVLKGRAVLSDVTRRDKSEPVPSADGGLTTVGLDMDVEDVGGGEIWSQGFHRSGREVLKGRECEAPLRRQEAARAWIARRSESAQACEAPPGEAAAAVCGAPDWLRGRGTDHHPRARGLDQRLRIHSGHLLPPRGQRPATTRSHTAPRLRHPPPTCSALGTVAGARHRPPCAHTAG